MHLVSRSLQSLFNLDLHTPTLQPYGYLARLTLIKWGFSPWHSFILQHASNWLALWCCSLHFFDSSRAKYDSSFTTFIRGECVAINPFPDRSLPLRSMWLEWLGFYQSQGTSPSLSSSLLACLLLSFFSHVLVMISILSAHSYNGHMNVFLPVEFIII